MVLLINYICGIVLVELKLLQVLCNKLTSLNNIFDANSGFKAHWEKKEPIAAVKKHHNRYTFYVLNETL